MQREQNLWGLQCLLWPAHAKLLIYAADSVLAFQFQAPTRFKNARCLFNCVSSTVYHSPYCDTVLNGFWTCPYIYMSALFCLFSSHKFLRLFTFVHPFFLLPFVPPFYFHYSFPLSHFSVHLFHRPQIYSSARFIWCDYLLACFSFRLNPRATSGFLQLIYLLTPPE